METKKRTILDIMLQLFWVVILFTAKNSGACPEDKVLYMLLCAIGFTIAAK